MAKVYEAEPEKYKKGRLLGSGRGDYSMMDMSYRNGWSTDNTILEVSNPNDMNSRWRIYERKAINETAVMRDINNVKKRR